MSPAATSSFPYHGEPRIPSPPVKTDFPLTSPRGPSRLATRVWAPGQETRAILVIVHGAGWHSGYYDSLGRFLSIEHGIFCAAYDQPGFGYSEEDPNAPRGCIHVYGLEEFVEEVFEAVNWAQKEARSTSLPVFLLGESFGGVEVLLAAMDAPVDRGVEQRLLFSRPKLAGVIVLCPAIRVHKDLLPPPFVLRIVTFLARYYAKMKVPAGDLSGDSFDEAFGNREWGRVARQDANVICLPQFTLGAAAATLNSADQILGDAAKGFPVPLLAIHSERDGRVQFEATQELVELAGAEAELMKVDSSGHMMLQDTAENVEAVMKKIASWIQQKIAED